MAQETKSPKALAAEFDAAIGSLPKRNTPNVRAVRKQYTQELKGADPEFILALVEVLHKQYGYWGPAFELIRNHRKTFQSLGEPELTSLGQGMNSWWTVDSFARTLAGPAWLRGQIEDDLVRQWAQSDDLWWRRAALVCTVALNMRSQGGYGDTSRTLEICEMLVDDHEDMVVKGLSWALRELVPHDPEAVEAFLAQYEDRLAARVKREVRNKLRTGLKNPKK
jgi:3-methyladenine DNA glycosylase AlkD